jgi:hypothetical protein
MDSNAQRYSLFLHRFKSCSIFDRFGVEVEQRDVRLREEPNCDLMI